MKKVIYIFLLALFLFNCTASKRAPLEPSSKQTTEIASEKELAQVENDTVVIANDQLEYEIIIIEPGFNTWLLSRARPEGFYSQQYLENRNYLYVLEWNQRVLQPGRFNPNLYELQIDYQPNIDYGYDVNYKLFNYFIYFQLTYNERLAGFVPRI